jgi:uncharacterized protein
MMSIFLLTFFLLYGGAHLYTFIKARQALGFSASADALFALFLVFMVLSPLLIRTVERQGHDVAARLLAYMGYTWMGFLFLFFSAALAVDSYRLLLFLAEKLWHLDLGRYAVSPQAAFYLPFAWGIATTVYGYFEAWDIRTERIVVTSAKIPPDLKKLTIVQISDVHLGLVVRQERLDRMLARVRAASPDLLVCTGDLVDGQINSLAGLAEQFQKIQPRFGKYAVTGNHEFYAGLDHALAFAERSGFTVLRGRAVNVGSLITLVGVDDPTRIRDRGEQLQEERLLESLPGDKFTVLLKHRPVVGKGSLGRFDLQLSGHVHKGQLFPFNVLTYLFYPIRAGHTVFENGFSLYVSRGTGTWGPPVRFLAPPEVTVIEVVPADGG